MRELPRSWGTEVRSRTGLGAAAWLVSFAALAAADGPVLRVESDVPRDQRGVSGAPFLPAPTFDVRVVLDGSPGGDGRVRAWSFGVTHDADALELIQVSFRDTDAAGWVAGTSPDLVLLEIVGGATGAGAPGFVAAVVAAEADFVLPAGRAAALAGATYIGRHPVVRSAVEREIRIAPVAGLAPAAGTPVPLAVEDVLGVATPAVEPLTLRLATAPICDARLTFELSAPGARRVADAASLRAVAAAGESFTLETTALLRTDIEGDDGPQGWSIAVTHDPTAFDLLDAGAEDSVVDEFRDNGFFDHSLVVAGTGASARVIGYTSVAILSFLPFDPAVMLPPRGGFVIARARYTLAAAHDRAGNRLRSAIRFRDGLQAPEQGVPVDNVVTLDGKSERPCDLIALEVDLELVDPAAGPRFVRGDVDGDGRIRIGDALALLRAVFVTGRPLACAAAADADADGGIAITDVIYLLDALYRRGAPPPPPFPSCGPAPDALATLDCAASRERCP